MEKTEKKGLLTRIQDYLDSPSGRILLNYLYSWGAAVVILGALFKLTHIKGANLMLFIGMGTEVLVQTYYSWASDRLLFCKTV